MPTIQLQQVSKRYDRRGAPSVQQLDLTIHEGEFMCLLGPSGCGKSTTLRMIAGLEHASGGEIRLGERLAAPTQYTSFKRLTMAPAEVVTIYYDSRANLLAQGVIPATVGRKPNPFPGNFVPDPEG